MTQNPARFDIWSHDASTGGQASPEGLARFGEWIGGVDREVTVGSKTYLAQDLLNDPETALNLDNYATPGYRAAAYVLVDSATQATLVIVDKSGLGTDRFKFPITI